MNVKGLVIGTLLASGVLLSLTGFLGDMASTYGFDDNSTVLNQLSMIDELGSSVNDTQNLLQQGQYEQTGSDVWNGVWTAITNLLNLPIIFFGMIGELLSFNALLGVPNWVGGFIFTLMITLIVYAILRSLRGGDT